MRAFGDAELARLIAPRRLIVEAAHGPEIAGPPAETKDRTGRAPIGVLTTPSPTSVKAEILRSGTRGVLVESEDGDGALSLLLGVKALKPPTAAQRDGRIGFHPDERLHRQFDELIAYTQLLVRRSPMQRAEFWSKADSSSSERSAQSTPFYRNYVWDELIGRLPDPALPPEPRTRLIYDEPKFRGYEVTLNVWPDAFAYGILLVPKGIPPGERRPVVVCQHGLEGRPSETADPKSDSHFYHRFAARLAEEGFVTFSPQNPYIFEDRFRSIQRKAHPLKLSLFSFILGQHQAALNWLVQTLNRRAFCSLAAAATSAPLASASKNIRVAVLGTGHAHAPGKIQALRSLSDYESVGIRRPDADEPNHGSAFEGVRWLSLDEILDDPSIELVDMESDVQYYLKYAQKCVSASKFVHLDNALRRPGGVADALG